MPLVPRKKILAVLTAMLLASLATGCATVEHKAKSSKLAHRKAGALPKNYSLFSATTINYKLLRKGQRTRGGPALDTY